jgi:N-acetylmuramoyl-L-alanine amidase
MRRFRFIHAVLVAAGVLVSTDATTAPPPIRPMDVVTNHALHESARGIWQQVQAATSAVDPKPLNARVIVLDPGHGGENTGALGITGHFEKLATLELAYAVRAELESRHPGVQVLMTRYWDRPVGLHERTQWANEVQADLFLSLHYNAASHDRALGFETYFLAEETMAKTSERGVRRGQSASKEQKRAFRVLDRAREKSHRAARDQLRPAHEASKGFAAAIQGAMRQHVQSIDRGVKEANFAVLRGAQMPAVVIEAGFLTHSTEGKIVLSQKHRKSVVQAIADGVEAFDKTRPAMRADAR